jgi:hypothetical protein
MALTRGKDPNYTKYTQNVFTAKHTATDDNKFKLAIMPTWLSECNIHVSSNDCKYGDRNEQDAEIKSGDVASFRILNLAEIYFKNATAGSNTVVTIVGTLMPDARRRELGLP